MRALVVGNSSDLDGGFVGHRFREHGYAFTECHREQPAAWPSLDGVELVLTLGSEWNVYRDETAASVEAEAAFVRDVLDQGVPLFAICFGAQVLAHALGGTVTRTDRPEIGWFDIDPLDRVVGAAEGDETDDDHVAVAAGPWLEWHDDVFTVPDGFVSLASTGTGPQLIRGERALGTQFHPEATETMLARWLRCGGAEQYRRYGGEPTELLAQTRTNVERSRPNAEALVDWFLATVASA
ncbi:MAG: type 1 glutamine amidotransferase [Actinomycetota bacterium]|nr:type 1 glutamine amidotransferase [Actinomycetota bacterium]